MSYVYAEYNGDYLTPEQIEIIHASLLADLDAMAEMDADEPEAEMEPEAGI